MTAKLNSNYNFQTLNSNDVSSKNNHI
jgi:hypothetical protein